MPDFLLQAEVKRQVDYFIKNPSHALMLVGAQGSGKKTTGMYIVGNLLNIKQPLLSRYPYLILLEPEEGVISIDAIRKAKEQLKLKTIGKAMIRRILLIEDSHTMTIEAQNAFLKILEEPPVDTVIVMTAVGQHSLLPTVYSRVQQIFIRSMAKNRLAEHFAAMGYSDKVIEKSYHISNGQVGLMSALLAEDSDHALVSAINLAKNLLASPAYERLMQIDSLAKQKQMIPDLLQAFQRIVRVALLQSSNTNKVKDIHRWHQASVTVHQAINNVSRNANTKLMLTHLFLNI